MVKRIVDAVTQLSTNPFPSEVRKLSGSQHSYRIRDGDYRVVDTVTTSKLVIEVIRVGHRQEVYDP